MLKILIQILEYNLGRHTYNKMPMETIHARIKLSVDFNITPILTHNFILMLQAKYILNV